MNTALSPLPSSIAMRFAPPRLPPEPTPIVLAALFRLHRVREDAVSDQVIKEHCAELAARLPCETIPGSDGSVYLHRYLVADLGPEGRIYLHNICRDDEDPELHSHPWIEARALILVAGYREQRRIRSDTLASGFDVATTLYRAGDTNIILADTFHRIELVAGPAWTIMLVGQKAVRAPREDSWSFLDTKTGTKTGYKTFLAQKAARIAAQSIQE